MGKKKDDQKNVLTNDLVDDLAGGRLPNGRFAKGRSGNTKGRPKKSAELKAYEHPMTIAALVNEVLRREVTVSGRKGPTTMPIAAAMVEAYVMRSLKGTPAEIRKLLDWVSRQNLLPLSAYFDQATRELYHLTEQVRKETRAEKLWRQIEAEFGDVELGDEDDDPEDEEAVAEARRYLDELRRHS